MTIQSGNEVTFDYTLTVDGKQIDSSSGRDPFKYTHGDGKIIRGLSKQLEGLRVGDEKEIEVIPEEAYGPVNPQAIEEVPKSAFPLDLIPEANMLIEVLDSKGSVVPARITEIKADSVLVDLNHPFAGKTLVFKVKIVSIK